MSSQSSRASFPLLPIEIQDMIWGYTMYPRAISLVTEEYNSTEATFVAPWYFALPDDDNYLDLTQKRPAHFTIKDLQAQCHAALRVSQRSRGFVLSQGYVVWKIQNREGYIQLFYWHPAIDVIVFPGNSYDTLEDGASRVNGHHLAGLFSLRYPNEAKTLKRVAVISPVCRTDPIIRLGWVKKKIEQFVSISELIIIRDTENERKVEARLIEEAHASTGCGILKLPDGITYALSRQKPWVQSRLGYEVKVPIVRVVESVDKVLSNQNLEISLLCAPWEWASCEGDSISPGLS